MPYVLVNKLLHSNFSVTCSFCPSLAFSLAGVSNGSGVLKLPACKSCGSQLRSLHNS